MYKYISNLNISNFYVFDFYMFNAFRSIILKDFFNNKDR